MKVRLHEPTFGEEEIAAAVAVMRTTNVTQGLKVREFERAFCKTFGFRHAVACNSGSSANLLATAAMCALDIWKRGDEIQVPALSWPTTVWPLVQYGLVPVFIDCDVDTFNAIPKSLPLSASVALPVYGNPCILPANPLMIEDCCEALGAPVGHNGMAATFSFYFSHHITTFEGGMVATDDDRLADMMRIIRSHGWVRDTESDEYAEAHPDIDPKFLFVEAGYNLRLTDVAAAIGLVQLPKLDAIVAQRRRNHRMYVEAIGEYGWLRPQSMHDDSSCFSFAMVLEGRSGTKEIRELLEAAGIETRPIIAGNMALQPGMQKYSYKTSGRLGNATYIMKNGFSIGNHQGIGERQIEYVANTIKAFACAH